ncbi:hypothetical protein WR25_23714 [Diploscapter pachys]|uniref:Neurotransmitter-gated ion-channel ligand-binding domain-containing protein n=1 Tax=Diploscapter pachys TaxID=2018661 RepID=A0A2A2JDK3_9BILA|nr:hypothetical protein WR25_23714 [Diploscapter pachys]
MQLFLFILLLLLQAAFQCSASNTTTQRAIKAKDMESQLYEELLFYYNKVPRPVKNSADILTVDVGASLIRIIDVDEKVDFKLRWDPQVWGGVKKLHIPADQIWLPDLVLYNNAAGDPDITILTDALVTYDGTVFWQPPAIYKSFCSIDVTWFPYDRQTCEMKFGTWTYTGRYVDLKQLPKEEVVLKKKGDDDIEYMEKGMDLSFFYSSAEWDLISLTSERHSMLYTSCCGPERFVDITYYFILRRKTLFFTCNLIIPCFLISILTTFVFYLPDHKITFSISILVTLTVFFLVLIDLMPPTSLVIPMFGRYLITTMILVSLSTVVSVFTVNFRFRSGSAHKMSPWIRAIFINFLPKILIMKRPVKKETVSETNKLVDPIALVGKNYVDDAKAAHNLRKERSKTNLREKPSTQAVLNNALDLRVTDSEGSVETSLKPFLCPRTTIAPTVQFKKTKRKSHVDAVIFNNLLQQVRFIAEHFRHNEKESEVSDDWVYAANVLDRLFLIIFSVLNVATSFIILEAPSLYDRSEPLNITVPSKPLGMASLFNA